MEDTLITLETAKLAKEKGFNDGETYISYHYHNSTKEQVLDGDRLFKEMNNYIPAPTQSLLQKWLREVHNIHIQNHFLNSKYAVKIKYDVNKSQNVYNKDTYEEALEEGLQEALKLI